jgi:hypothetical protein
VETPITSGGEMKEYKDKVIKEGVFVRKFDKRVVMSESTWHRDARDRLVEVVAGDGWKIQVDNRVPVQMKVGDVYRVPAEMWHRIIPGGGDLTVLIRETLEETMDVFGVDVEDVIDEMGEDYGGPMSPGVPASMAQDILLPEGEASSHEPGYKAPEGSARDRKLDAAKAAYKRGDVQAAVRIRDEMEKKAREKPGYKSRKSKYTDESRQPAKYPPVMSELEALDALDEDIMLEGLNAKTREALKKKAENSNAPLGALTTVYRKGLGAFYSSGSRPGMTAQQWAMARVNSFLKGGKARKVDAAQWKQVQNFRKR